MNANAQDMKGPPYNGGTIGLLLVGTLTSSEYAFLCLRWGHQRNSILT